MIDSIFATMEKLDILDGHLDAKQVAAELYRQLDTEGKGHISKADYVRRASAQPEMFKKLGIGWAFPGEVGSPNAVGATRNVSRRASRRQRPSVASIEVNPASRSRKRGTTVAFGHRNWDLVVQMMLAIRLSVSRAVHPAAAILAGRCRVERRGVSGAREPRRARPACVWRESRARVAASAMAAVSDLELSGYSIQSSPFIPGRMAVATSANFGIVGNGRMQIVQALPAGSVGGWPVLQHLSAYPTNSGLFDCAWSELAENHVLGASGDGSVKLWDVVGATDGRPLMAFVEHTAEAAGVDWNIVAKDTFASASWDGTLKVWLPDRPASLLTLAEHAHCVYECRWSPHHPSWLLSASGDHTCKLWDPRAGANSTLTVACGEGEVLSCDWSKYDGHVFATGSVDKTIACWDVRQPGAPISRHAGHNFAVRRVRFSPHTPPLLLSASYDMSVCLWDVSLSGRPPLRQYAHHTEFVVGVEWSLFEEGMIASCGWDASLHLWHRDGQPCAPRAAPPGAAGGGGAGPTGGSAPPGSGH